MHVIYWRLCSFCIFTVNLQVQFCSGNTIMLCSCLLESHPYMGHFSVKWSVSVRESPLPGSLHCQMISVRERVTSTWVNSVSSDQCPWEGHLYMGNFSVKWSVSVRESPLPGSLHCQMISVRERVTSTWVNSVSSDQCPWESHLYMGHFSVKWSGSVRESLLHGSRQCQVISVRERVTSTWVNSVSSDQCPWESHCYMGHVSVKWSVSVRESPLPGSLHCQMISVRERVTSTWVTSVSSDQCPWESHPYMGHFSVKWSVSVRESPLPGSLHCQMISVRERVTSTWVNSVSSDQCPWESHLYMGHFSVKWSGSVRESLLHGSRQCQVISVRERVTSTWVTSVSSDQCPWESHCYMGHVSVKWSVSVRESPLPGSLHCQMISVRERVTLTWVTSVSSDQCPWESHRYLGHFTVKWSVSVRESPLHGSIQCQVISVRERVTSTWVTSVSSDQCPWESHRYLGHFTVKWSVSVRESPLHGSIQCQVISVRERVISTWVTSVSIDQGPWESHCYMGHVSVKWSVSVRESPLHGSLQCQVISVLERVTATWVTSVSSDQCPWESHPYMGHVSVKWSVSVRESPLHGSRQCEVISVRERVTLPWVTSVSSDQCPWESHRYLGHFSVKWSVSVRESPLHGSIQCQVISVRERVTLTWVTSVSSDQCPWESHRYLGHFTVKWSVSVRESPLHGSIQCQVISVRERVTLTWVTSLSNDQCPWESHLYMGQFSVKWSASVRESPLHGSLQCQVISVRERVTVTWVTSLSNDQCPWESHLYMGQFSVKWSVSVRESPLHGSLHCQVIRVRERVTLTWVTSVSSDQCPWESPLPGSLHCQMISVRERVTSKWVYSVSSDLGPWESHPYMGHFSVKWSVSVRESPLHGSLQCQVISVHKRVTSTWVTSVSCDQCPWESHRYLGHFTVKWSVSVRESPLHGSLQCQVISVHKRVTSTWVTSVSCDQCPWESHCYMGHFSVKW